MIYRQIPRGFVRLTKNILCNPVADTQLGAQCRPEGVGDPGVQKWIESLNKNPSMGQPVNSAISWVRPAELFAIASAGPRRHLCGESLLRHGKYRAH